MPVYHLTFHAYGTWHEDHPNGFVQRGQGLQPSNTKLNAYRRKVQKHPEARFDSALHTPLETVMREVTTRFEITVYGLAITPTHLHAIASFRSPACVCEASRFCGKTCPAHEHIHAFAIRFKRDAGLRLAKARNYRIRKWFARGQDIKPIRNRDHFDRLLEMYLPKHLYEGGTVWVGGERLV